MKNLLIIPAHTHIPKVNTVTSVWQLIPKGQVISSIMNKLSWGDMAHNAVTRISETFSAVFKTQF